MTNEQILKKAIEKAVENGYKIPTKIRPQYEVNGWDVNMNWMKFHIIFSHSFAKAFWGEEKVVCNKCNIGCSCVPDTRLYVWQFNLMIMALEKEPLKYLEHFLNNPKILENGHVK